MRLPSAFWTCNSLWFWWCYWCHRGHFLLGEARFWVLRQLDAGISSCSWWSSKLRFLLFCGQRISELDRKILYLRSRQLRICRLCGPARRLSNHLFHHHSRSYTGVIWSPWSSGLRVPDSSTAYNPISRSFHIQWAHSFSNSAWAP